MIYKYGEQAIKDSLNVLKIENHRKRESYVHKLLDYIMVAILRTI